MGQRHCAVITRNIRNNATKVSLLSRAKSKLESGSETLSKELSKVGTTPLSVCKYAHPLETCVDPYAPMAQGYRTIRH